MSVADIFSEKCLRAHSRTGTLQTNDSLLPHACGKSSCHPVRNPNRPRDACQQRHTAWCASGASTETRATTSQLADGSLLVEKEDDRPLQPRHLLCEGEAGREVELGCRK